jgi:hypothetical protein
VAAISTIKSVDNEQTLQETVVAIPTIEIVQEAEVLQELQEPQTEVETIVNVREYPTKLVTLYATERRFQLKISMKSKKDIRGCRVKAFPSFIEELSWPTNDDNCKNVIQTLESYINGAPELSSFPIDERHTIFRVFMMSWVESCKLSFGHAKKKLSNTDCRSSLMFCKKCNRSEDTHAYITLHCSQELFKIAKLAFNHSHVNELAMESTILELSNLFQKISLEESGIGIQTSGDNNEVTVPVAENSEIVLVPVHVVDNSAGVQEALRRDEDMPVLSTAVSIPDENNYPMNLAWPQTAEHVKIVMESFNQAFFNQNLTGSSGYNTALRIITEWAKSVGYKFCVAETGKRKKGIYRLLKCRLGFRMCPSKFSLTERNNASPILGNFMATHRHI